MSTSTTWQETIAPDEDARFALYTKRLVQLQQQGQRALHAKSHGLLSAKLEIGEVPAELRHGLAAKQGGFDPDHAAIRTSLRCFAA